MGAQVSARMAASLARQGPKAAAQLSKQSAAVNVAARMLSTSSQQVCSTYYTSLPQEYTGTYGKYGPGGSVFLI